MRNATRASLLLAAQSCGVACSRKSAASEKWQACCSGEAPKQTTGGAGVQKVNKPSGPAMSCRRRRTGRRRRKEYL